MKVHWIVQFSPFKGLCGRGVKRDNVKPWHNSPAKDRCKSCIKAFPHFNAEKERHDSAAARRR